MAMMTSLSAASKVASSVSNLKSRYVKYLEALCNANGIDISTLKTEGAQYEKLEIFFGGLPVLIGLKYFDHLRVLRLFGQDIVCLRPLVEVASTLEELWICEGVLKELGGIENCKKLKELYLYDNAIEDATPLEALQSLSTLHIQCNKLTSISFLDSLHYLTNLSVADNNLRDGGLLTTSRWPSKLQTVDVSGNQLTSFRSLFGIHHCETLRCVCVSSSSSPPSSLLPSDLFLTAIAFHHRFIEYIDKDPVTEKFVPAYLPIAENRLSDAYSQMLKEEDNYQTQLKTLDKHAVRVSHRLSLFAQALDRLKDSLSGNNEKKELIKRVRESTAQNLKTVGLLKKNWRVLAHFQMTIRRFTIANDLEASGISYFKDADENTNKMLEHFMNYHCSAKGSYQLSFKWCWTRRNLQKSDVDRMFYIDCDTTTRLFEEKHIVDLLDRHVMADYREPPIRVYKDFEVLRKEAKDKVRIFFVVLVLSRSHQLVQHRSHTPSPRPNTADDSMVGTLHVNESNVAWKDLRLAAVGVVEMMFPNQLRLDDVSDMETFDRRFDEQIEKLKEININIDLKEEKYQKKDLVETVDITAMGNEEDAAKPTKLRKVRDMLNSRVLHGRWSVDGHPTNPFSIRSPVELVLAYGRCRTMPELVEFQNTVTTLDLSSQKLTKLGGIEEMRHLVALSLKNNKLISIKKVASLSNLQCLDVSENRLHKIDALPELLSHLNVSDNRLIGLNFCSKLQLLTELFAQRNHIKAMKGIEGCKLLKILLLANNQIKEKHDLDIFKNLQKMFYLDMSGNALTHIEGYRGKLLHELPYLLVLDREKVPVEERTFIARKAGKALTIEGIEKMYPDYEKRAVLDLSNGKYEMIAIERGAIPRLNHIESIDLSSNQLQKLQDITELRGLKKLNLSKNSLMSIAVEYDSDDTKAGNEAKLLPSLTHLDLSYNELTNSTLFKFGLTQLENLVELRLNNNNLTKFDCYMFDLPCLSYLDLSNNEIKTIRKKAMPSLTFLSLENNRLKEIDGLSLPCIETLNIAGNRICTCAGIKSLGHMPKLTNLNCLNNPVTDRRVYTDFVKKEVRSLQIFDGVPVEAKESSLGEIKKSRSPLPPSNVDTLVVQKTRRRSSTVVVKDRVVYEIQTEVVTLDDFFLAGTRSVKHVK